MSDELKQLAGLLAMALLDMLETAENNEKDDNSLDKNSFPSIHGDRRQK